MLSSSKTTDVEAKNVLHTKQERKPEFIRISRDFRQKNRICLRFLLKRT